MESLLSLSFDYLSSFDGLKIKKGLRQLEGLLAQICLSRRSSASTTSTSTSSRGVESRQQQSPVNTSYGQVSEVQQHTKELASLKDDPAFREFFKLQEGFEWNGRNPREEKHAIEDLLREG